MQNTVKERLVKYYEYKSYSKSGFEKYLGFSNGYIDKLRNCPSNDKLEIIYLKCPDLNRVWLLTGEGEMLNQGPPLDITKAALEYEDLRRQISEELGKLKTIAEELRKTQQELSNTLHELLHSPYTTLAAEN